MTDMKTFQDLRDELRVAVGDNAAAWGREKGLSEAHISLVLSGSQKAGPKMAKALGYRKIIRFEPLQTNEGVK